MKGISSAIYQYLTFKQQILDSVIILQVAANRRAVQTEVAATPPVKFSRGNSEHKRNRRKLFLTYYEQNLPKF